MEQVKRILIPTDFTVKSLTLVRKALDFAKEERIKITLVCPIRTPDSITELMFYSKSKLIKSLQTPEFKDACQLIENKYHSTLEALHLDIITSDNRRYFNQYLEAQCIDQIFIPLHYNLEMPHRLSFDPSRLFAKCPVKVSTISWQTDAAPSRSKTNQVADIFFPKMETSS